jgi:hypothetical protein
VSDNSLEPQLQAATVDVSRRWVEARVLADCSAGIESSNSYRQLMWAVKSNEEFSVISTRNQQQQQQQRVWNVVERRTIQ